LTVARRRGGFTATRCGGTTTSAAAALATASTCPRDAGPVRRADLLAAESPSTERFSARSNDRSGGPAGAGASATGPGPRLTSGGSQPAGITGTSAAAGWGSGWADGGYGLTKSPPGPN